MNTNVGRTLTSRRERSRLSMLASSTVEPPLFLVIVSIVGVAFFLVGVVRVEVVVSRSRYG
jgi:hypothetical protein